jgi:hypothetical protein
MAARNLPIPRSAPITDTIIGTNAHGATVTVTRHGPDFPGGERTEWVAWDRVNPDGSRERWAERITGYRLKTLADELDKIHAQLVLTAAGATRTRTV